MDLKRVSLSYHHGSVKTAKIFENEAKKRIAELNKAEVDSYLLNFIKQIPEKFKSKNADDLLMYSTIIQNNIIKNG